MMHSNNYSSFLTDFEEPHGRKKNGAKKIDKQ